MKHNQNGASSTLLLLIVSLVLLVFVGMFAIIEAGSASSAKSTLNQQINSAVAKAQSAQQTTDNATFQKQSESPYLTYTSAATYGNISFNYPRNWSAYVNSNSGNGQSTLLDGYFFPGILPSVDDTSATNFAFRVSLISTDYGTTLTGLTTAPTVVVTSPYSLPKVPNVIGAKLTGNLGNSKTGTMIILPLRGQTLEIFTEGSSYNNEFNTIILASLKFTP